MHRLASTASTVAATAVSAARPFQVLGVQQIAIGGEDKSSLVNLWVNLLGLTHVGTYRSEKENVDEDILRAGRGPWAVEVDIMQPIDAGKAPKVHVPPLNHIGLWIDHLPAAVAWLEERGIRIAPGGIRKGAAGFDVAFLHPKSTGGVLIELVAAPPSIITAHGQLQ